MFCLSLKNCKPRYESRQPKMQCFSFAEPVTQANNTSKSSFHSAYESCTLAPPVRVQHRIELLAITLRALNRLRKNSSSLVTNIHTDTTVGIPLINSHGCSLAISQSFQVFWVKYFHSGFKRQIINFLNPDQWKTFKNSCCIYSVSPHPFSLQYNYL